MMDISKEYIEMCSKAEEIQKLLTNEIKMNPKEFVHKVVTGNVYQTTTYTWLPRQDQLQEFFKNNKLSFFGNDYEFRSQTVIENKHVDTYEKLWLLYYMKMKHNKKWDNEIKDWVKF